MEKIKNKMKVGQLFVFESRDSTAPTRIFLCLEEPVGSTIFLAYNFLKKESQDFNLFWFQMQLEHHGYAAYLI